jgi:hypothetical protein
VKDPDGGGLFGLGLTRSDGYTVRTIGEFLYLPESALDEIRNRYQSKAKRKEAYLDTYVHYHPCPSWKAIHKLLGQCSLDQQAEEVEITYVQGMHTLYRACIQCSYLKAGERGATLLKGGSRSMQTRIKLQTYGI